MKKILITGGCGFIGTNFIADLLKEGYDSDNIAILDNLGQGTYMPEIHDKVKFYEGDIRKPNDLEDAIDILGGVDIIYHFAGLVSIYDCDKNQADCYDNNLMGSINVFNIAVKYNVKVVFSETSAVYEDSYLYQGGYREEQSDPKTIYSTSKAAVASLAESYKKLYGMKWVALRYFNVAGCMQDYTRTVPPLFAGVIIRYMQGNKPIIFGDETRERDFIHVDDVNAFHRLLLDNKDITGTFNLGTGRATSLIDIVKVIAHKMGKKVDFIQFPEINGEAHTIYANIVKAQMFTEWKPIKTIHDAIQDTIEYLKDQDKLGNIPENFMESLDVEAVKI